MNQGLEGKTALITGAGRGIGKAVAIRLAREKINLALNARTEKELQAVGNTISKSRIKHLIVPGDLCLRETPLRIINRTAAYFGGIDILINNAGVAESSSVESTSIELWEKHMSLNALAPLLLCREAIPHLRNSSFATIINISSVVGRRGYENQCAYSASKHALNGFTESLGKELQEDGIRVHLISPGGVSTGMVKNTRPDLDDKSLISPEDIAETVVFLLMLRNTNAAVDNINIRRAGSEPFV